MEYQKHTFPGARGDTPLSVRKFPRGPLKYRDVYEAVKIAFNRSAGQEDESDVYDINLHGIDPVAVAQNACVVLEERSGIYPNMDQADRTENVVMRDDQPLVSGSSDYEDRADG